MKTKKRSDGRYCRTMTVVVNGVKTRKYFYGSSQAELTRLMREYKEQQANGSKFTDIADEWWEDAEPKISPTTIDSYKRAKKRAAEYFANQYIKDITPLMCSTYLTYIVKKYEMAKNTASNHRSVLNQIFIFAISKGYLQYNPLRDVAIPKGLKKTPRKGASEADIEQIKKSVNTTFGLYSYMAMYTGLRKGELLALTWEDIDLEHRTISVTKSIYFKNCKAYIKQPKTETGIRKVPIVDKLLPVLERNKSTGIVFTGRHGEYMTDWEYHDLYESYQKEAGITATSHQLRHSFATMLLEADIDVKSAQHILGHAQASTTQDIYQEIRKSREETINDKLYTADL